ncbi:MAG: hypothetical protein FWJ65_06715 [Limnochordales bacterium]
MGKLELLLDNRNGNVWDISQIVSQVTWTTTRRGRPGKLELTLIKGALYQDPAFAINSGDVLRFRDGSHNVFYGYVFTVDGGQSEAVKITAYDQIRYLLAKDTYVFAGATATEIIRQIAGDYNLRVGRLDDTGYRIPTMVEDGQTLLDIIEKALTLTLINTGRNFVFFDDFGALALRNVEDLLLDFAIADGGILIDYSYKRSIDEETYNRVKLVRNNQETGRRDVYLAQDSASIARWGVLQLYQMVDEDMNEAQIQQLLDTLIQLHNRETRSLKVKAIGDSRVRAGYYVTIGIQEYGISQPFLVDQCKHTWSDTDHTMELELKVV